MGGLGVMIAAGLQVAPVPLAPVAPADMLGGSKTLVAGTLIALIIIMVVIAPMIERFKALLGKWLAAPIVETHNESDRSHADLRLALATISGAIAAMQRQIDNNERVRRESIAGLRSQLETAIELLERE